MEEQHCIKHEHGDSQHDIARSLVTRERFELMREEILRNISVLEEEVFRKCERTSLDQETQTITYDPPLRSDVCHASTQTDVEKSDRYYLTTIDSKIEELKAHIDKQLNSILVQVSDFDNSSGNQFEEDNASPRAHVLVYCNNITEETMHVGSDTVTNNTDSQPTHWREEPSAFTTKTSVSSTSRIHEQQSNAQIMKSNFQKPSRINGNEERLVQENRESLTRNLVETSFSRVALANSNIKGARGKFMLDPIKIARIRAEVFCKFPANDLQDEERIWRLLATKINTKCRGVKRLFKRKNLSQPKVAAVDEDDRDKQ